MPARCHGYFPRSRTRDDSEAGEGAQSLFHRTVVSEINVSGYGGIYGVSQPSPGTPPYERLSHALDGVAYFTGNAEPAPLRVARLE